VNQWWLMQRNDMSTCHSIKLVSALPSVTPQEIEACFQEHGIEGATEVDG